jgi:hypothetical protein
MSTVTGIRIDTNGTLAVCQLDQAADGSLLTAMYEALDVRVIEMFELPGRIDVIFDEEGKLNGSEPNPCATIACQILGGEFLRGDYIVGHALFLGSTDEGETVSLTQDQMRRIITASIE